MGKRVSFGEGTSQDSKAQDTATAASRSTSTATSTASSSATSSASSSATSTDCCEKNCGTPLLCGKNEEPTKCLPCDDNCDGTPKSCELLCKDSPTFCKCKKGFCRDNNWGKCIEKCKKNEVLVECKPCGEKCDNTDEVCPAICKGPYCKCEDGYCRDKSGKCIKRCGKNEEPTECFPCDPYCDGESHFCPLYCSSDHEKAFCKCKDGYCRDRQSGECIEKCGKNEILVRCKPCGEKCDNPNEVCTKDCRGPYCACIEKFCRDKSGKCIKKCGKNEEPTECSPCDQHLP